MLQSQEPLTIFYTDDDPDDQDIFKEVLSEIDQQYHVFTQSHGDELLSLLKNPPPSPHLVFLDLNMPFKNGYEVLKEMRDAKGIERTPVVIFTTSNDSEAIAMTEKLGADMFVSKPTSYKEMRETLQNVLSQNWTLGNSNRQNFLYRS